MPKFKEGEDNTKEMLIKIKQGDLEALEKFVNYYILYSKKIASEYFGLGIDEDEIISYAYLGLMEAVNVLENGDNKFISSVISRNIRKVIEENILIFYYLDFKRNTNKATKVFEYLKAKRDLKNILHRNPNKKELCDYLSFDLGELNYIISLFNKTTIYDESESEDDLDIESLYLEQESLIELKNLIVSFFPSSLEIKVLYLRNKMNLSMGDIAKIFNVSRERIHQIEHKAKVHAYQFISAYKNDSLPSKEMMMLSKKYMSELIRIFQDGNMDAYNYMIDYYKNIALGIIEEYTDYFEYDKIVSIINERANYIVNLYSNRGGISIKREIRVWIEMGILESLGYKLKNVSNYKSSNLKLRKVLLEVLNATLVLRSELLREPSDLEISKFISEDVDVIEKAKKLVVGN